MTREMNKPEWEQKFYWQRVDYDVYIARERKLDDWIKPFFDSCCRMEKVNVGKR